MGNSGSSGGEEGVSGQCPDLDAAASGAELSHQEILASRRVEPSAGSALDQEPQASGRAVILSVFLYFSFCCVLVLLCAAAHLIVSAVGGVALLASFWGNNSVRWIRTSNNLRC